MDSETFSERAVGFIRNEIKACTNVGKLVAATSLYDARGAVLDVKAIDGARLTTPVPPPASLL